MTSFQVRSAALISFAVLSLGLAACGDSTPPAVTPVPETTAPVAAPVATVVEPVATAVVPAAPAPKDLVETAVAAGTFKTLVELAGAADLAGMLKGAGPFTILAPTDAAFAKVPADIVAALKKPENKALLVQVLQYHVISGAVMAADVTKLKVASPVEGENLPITVAGSTVTFGAGANKANVTAADIKASNGVIHVLDAVLIPPVVAAQLDPKGKDIVDTAVGAKFTTLVAAVTKAELAKSLKAPGPFTVFAPTDAAFKKLGKITMTKDALTPILTYHVVTGIKGSAAIASMNGKDVMTLGGKTFKIKVVGADVMLTDGKGVDVKVTATDIATKNGLIHVIDTVLMSAK
jgi:transforming growth factor-beta-induced protein